MAGRREEACSRCCSLRGSYQFIGCVFTFSACYYGQRRLYVNGLGRFMAEGYFHPVNAINSRVTGWRLKHSPAALRCAA